MRRLGNARCHQLHGNEKLFGQSFLTDFTKPERCELLMFDVPLARCDAPKRTKSSLRSVKLWIDNGIVTSAYISTALTETADDRR